MIDSATARAETAVAQTQRIFSLTLPKIYEKSHAFNLGTCNLKLAGSVAVPAFYYQHIYNTMLQCFSFTTRFSLLLFLYIYEHNIRNTTIQYLNIGLRYPCQQFSYVIQIKWCFFINCAIKNNKKFIFQFESVQNLNRSDPSDSRKTFRVKKERFLFSYSKRSRAGAMLRADDENKAEASQLLEARHRGKNTKFVLFLVH